MEPFHGGQRLLDVIVGYDLVQGLELFLHPEYLADQVLILIAERIQQLAELQVAGVDDVLEGLEFALELSIILDNIFLIDVVGIVQNDLFFFETSCVQVVVILNAVK